MKHEILNHEKKSYKIILWALFCITMFLSINLFLVFANICYLPINTTGECVIATSLMSYEYSLLFMLGECVINILITVLFLIDGFRYNIKLNKILCILNILLQPFFVMIVLLGVIG